MVKHTNSTDFLGDLSGFFVLNVLEVGSTKQPVDKICQGSLENDNLRINRYVLHLEPLGLEYLFLFVVLFK
jgi:hypothetical protein